jgi:ribosome maturation factor RimP
MAERRGRGMQRGAAHGAAARSAHQPRAATARPAGAPPVDQATQRARLREIIEPVVAAGGYDLEGLTVSRVGRRFLLRLTVDGDHGVSLDAVADISRQVSAALDAAEARGGELLPGAYQLEVSSPGVDRPLTAPRQWRRNIGRLVQVRADDRQLTGRIVAADEERVVLDVAGTAEEFRHDQIGPGRVQLEFGRLAELPDAHLEDVPDGVDDDDSTGADVREDEE